jgi:hypothetical protein
MSPSAPSHPYAALGAERFWKTGVAERGGGLYQGLWTPRFALARGMRFVTAGSCFAQHISRWLRANGHTWLDAEPAPAELDAAAAAARGHGVFSFRTGNIYSAALLAQWLRWAEDPAQAPDEAWEEQGRWFDPFRPAIPPDGESGRDVLLASRRRSLLAMREVLAQADVFIFTLGLTETWLDERGWVYPLCPGTVRGRFDAGLHRFADFGVADVVGHVEEALLRMRRINPDLKLLLTVSPVPLTATASDRHVLVATMQSKSVLRAAAAELVSRHPTVDYFPSYELIAGAASRGRWFDDNLRTVTREGVDHVMAHFALGLGDAVTEPAAAAVRAAPPRSTRADEVACEDTLLASWNRHGAARAAELRLCLVGDSHMGKLSQALSRAGVAHCGGMIMKGSSWAQGLFHPDADEVLVALEGPLSRRRWQQTLPYFGQGDAAGRTIVTNLGLHTHVAVPRYLAWMRQQPGGPMVDLEQAIAYYRQAHAKLLRIVKGWCQQGFDVLVVTDPPTQGLAAANQPLLPVFELFELVATHVLGELGCRVFHTRKRFPPASLADEHFSPHRLDNGQRDWVHGSNGFYDALAAALADVLQPAARAAEPAEAASAA